MKIVITGATGHLGRYVTHHLASLGHSVIAASRTGKYPDLPYKCSPVSIEPLAVDIALEESVEILAQAMQGGAALVHLAAWHPPATASTTVEDRRTLLEINALGTMRVYEAAKKASASTIIFASTFEVYGDTRDNPMTEHSRRKPLTDYGATKLTGEDHLCSLTAEDKIPGISLRMPAIYGPGEHTSRALPNFLRAVAQGKRPTVAGDGADTRDQLHVRDAALAFEQALQYGSSGIFNIADGKEHSILELAKTAMLVAGMEGDPEVIPRVKERRDYHMSIDHAARELGFTPQVGLVDGMREQFDWLRSL